MKIWFILFSLLLLHSCADESSNITSADSDSSHTHTLVDLNPEVHLFAAQLSDTLRVDINGDHQADEIIFVKQDNSKAEVEIRFGGQSNFNPVTILTAEGVTVNNFDWADSWALFDDTVTTVTYSVDGEIRDSTFTLENPAILLWQEGGGAGFITFKNGKFTWMTQGC